MSVRVVARIRPLAKSENEKDVIVRCQDGSGPKPTSVKIPNPKNFGEEYSFQFNNVYDQDTTQQEFFDAEVSPTVKQLFLGFDVTLFAYGCTGTGKTFTMRGGKSLADRGMIPRLLSSIYRKSRAIEKSSDGETLVTVSMSYYEIYNDRVFDLFEPAEQRTATGLPIREAEGGKTVVVGLTEVPCGTLKEFEALYDKANANRSTGATKLNAHSSRSHAILCVKVTIASPTETRISMASAIDLAGSEDNRRTGNGKERMVESASINRSLFVLAQCVEAISKKQARIPYRESKMTRILSLGQNNGFTIMILNLAPVKSYHLDTLSSLNFANRTKKIEVREVENEPLFKGPPRQTPGLTSVGGLAIQRQPLRPLTNGANVNLAIQRDALKSGDKPAKAFSVYSDKNRPTATQPRPSLQTQRSPMKRAAESTFLSSTRPNKTMRPTPTFIRQAPEITAMTKSSIESLVEKKVSEILAARAMNAEVQAPTKDISEEVQRRLNSIEQRLAGQEGERAEGLSFLFMAKQHQARGEHSSALKMYQLAEPYFPDNEKLSRKIERLQDKLAQKNADAQHPPSEGLQQQRPYRQARDEDDTVKDEDESYQDDQLEGESYHSDGEESFHGRVKRSIKPSSRKARISSPDPLGNGEIESTPRTRHLLDIINTRDISRLKLLNGLGAKRAGNIIESLSEMDEERGQRIDLRSWDQLGRLRGIGKKTLESMRLGVEV